MAEPEPLPEAAAPSAWALTYARQRSDLLGAPPKGKVRVALLTDPWSVWCWGWEPVRRALELRYPGIAFQAFVGGMFPRLPDPREVGFDIERFFATVQRTTGMPVLTTATLRDRPESTYPACVHVHAARLLAPEKEAAFLRALRETVYLDGKNVSRPEVAAEVAERVGLGAREFREALASGEPEREFRERVAMLQGLGLQAYPTFLITHGEKTARVEGFQSLPSLLGIVEAATGKLQAPGPAPTLEQAIPPGERVGTREVAEALGWSVEQAYDQLRREVESGRLARDRHPSGDTWRRP